MIHLFRCFSVLEFLQTKNSNILNSLKNKINNLLTIQYKIIFLCTNHFFFFYVQMTLFMYKLLTANLIIIDVRYQLSTVFSTSLLLGNR
jgi:hypothetical protein